MADVAVGQKISATADARFAVPGRAPIDGHEFAKRVLVADLEIRRFAGVFQILRLLADRGVGVKLVPRASACRSANRDVVLQPAVGAEHDASLDDAIWTDDGPGAELRSAINDRSRMNL